eukprot:c20653_g1_i2.p1 GENE.c20653_g1_i2~~c20653_g1_i2.p1  ORF type:complete len:182 (+),score=26.45 c20653_g1_i2:48-593(+)
MEDGVRCRNCGEGFSVVSKEWRPRMLMCGHFFCARCLGEMLANSAVDQSIVCPFDRMVTGPLTDVHKNLPPHLALIQSLACSQVERFQQVQHQQVEGVEAYGSGPDDDELGLFGVSVVGGAGMRMRTGMCADHRQAFQGYDVECGRLVCGDCIFRGEHNGHVLRGLDEIGGEWCKDVEEVQ